MEIPTVQFTVPSLFIKFDKKSGTQIKKSASYVSPQTDIDIVWTHEECGIATVTS